jgi:S1-C subfamily serine protease
MKLRILTILALTTASLILAGCATTPEQEAQKRRTEAQRIQQKYASYTTPELQLRRQEIASTIPAWYWGTGLSGAIQAGQIEGKKKDVAEIDRELLRRAESGDKTGQQRITFIVASDPPGAKIEGDGKFLGIAPNVITFSGNPGATSTLRATPVPLDRPMFGYLQGFSEEDGKLMQDYSAMGVVDYVFPDTPASRMGLAKGDKIIGVNGTALPEVTGTKESASAYGEALREQVSRIGFGGDATLKILRDGKQIELRGRTIDQLDGVYYVQEKTIQPMRFRSAVVMFDLATPTAMPIALSSSTGRPTSPKGTTSTGTGFVVAEGGYVLTCHHVVEKSEEIEIRDSTGAKHTANVVASDAGNDLCLLHADDLHGKPIPAAPPNSVSIGEAIYLLGFPMEGVLDNPTPVAGNGVVASLRGLKGDPRHLQVTVPINPGNSGGPVLNSYGNWVAVASHKLNDLYSVVKTESVPQGVNFAVKGTLVIPLFDSIPEVKLPVGDSKEKVSLEVATKRFSESIVLITARR